MPSKVKVEDKRISDNWDGENHPFYDKKEKLKMITNNDVYRCYSVNLMQFMAENDIRYFIVAKDIKSNKVFYGFEKTTKFKQLLQQWIDNNPKK